MGVESQEDLQKLLNSYDAQSKDIVRRIHDIIFHMNGAITREEAWRLSHEEQEDFIKRIIQKNEAQKAQF